MKQRTLHAAAFLLAAGVVMMAPCAASGQGEKISDAHGPDAATTTPIKHVVVIFQENESFDHYFGTYPDAANPSGETPFHARPGTPTVNGISHTLTERNPNGPDYAPFRLDPSQNYTCDMTHSYTPEQQAYDSGLMDKFPQFTAGHCGKEKYPSLAAHGPGVVMGHYDGNTVTALWNYAQYFSMSDNSHGSTFGPSSVGAINLASGMTGNVDKTIDNATGGLARDVVNDTIIGDPSPLFEDCYSYDRASLKGPNIGDLLNAKGISWGWFQGGFTPTQPYDPGGDGRPAKPAVCGAKTPRLDGKLVGAYAGYHDPFQFYASTSNPHHLPPASAREIGHDGPANHNYDLSDFWQAALDGNLPAVSFLKANRAQDGHPGYSSPLDEQQWIADAINKLESLPEWDSTAIFIAWDDSDGWYDHVMGPIVNQSTTKADALTGPGACGAGANSLEGIQARCGYGPRLPLLVVSPWARENFVDSSVTDQSSIIRFIEDNWGLGRIGGGSFDAIAGPLVGLFDFNHARHDKLFLDPATGEVIAAPTD
ncbi:MAG: alkaline phosphatase family protein [Candidatus Acidiferrales bacterium]